MKEVDLHDRVAVCQGLLYQEETPAARTYRHTGTLLIGLQIDLADATSTLHVENRRDYIGDECTVKKQCPGTRRQQRDDCTLDGVIAKGGSN